MSLSQNDCVLLLGGVGVASLTLYAVMGGADYGGGFWDLLATGPRKAEQRKTIEKAIGPIWEANHVWLILIVVLLFSCFPRAFYTASIALHIPLTLLLFGIVLRGSAFTFRTYDSEKDEVQKRWGRIFAISSTITPLVLGTIVGAISGGHIITKGDFFSVYLSPWLRPFPIAVGFFALMLFAYLAAVYLTADTKEPLLQNDFRLRAYITQAITAALALTVYLLAREGAPDLWHDMHIMSPIYVGTFITAVATVVFLATRRFTIARFCAAAQVAFILWGWALAQYPYIIRPSHTIFNSASHIATLELVLMALAVGGFLLFPSFFFLYHVFKIKRTTSSMPGDKLKEQQS